MTLCWDDVTSSWCLPDFADIFRVVVHLPACWLSALCLYIFANYLWPDTLNTWLLISHPRPLSTSWQFGALVAFTNHWGDLARLLGTYFLLPGFESIASSDCFTGGSTQSVLVFCGYACLVFPYLTLEFLLRTLPVASCGAHLLEDMLVQIMEPAEFRRIYCPSVSLSSDCQTHCVGSRSWWPAVLLLFE